MTLGTPIGTRSSAEPADTSLHPTPPSHHRFHLLDGLRGIAAFMVVLYHMPRFMCTFAHTAFLSVDFFFCLSGFVIGFSYEKRLLAGMRMKDFFAARIIRLYPTYLLAILLSLCLLLTSLNYPLTTSATLKLMALTVFQLGMLPNLHFWPGGYLFPLDRSAWSLFYELLANIALAALIRKKLAGSRAMLLITTVSFFLLLFLAIRGHGIQTGAENSWRHMYMGVTRVTLSFSTGMLTLHLFHRTGRPALNLSLQRLIPVVLITALIFILSGPIRAMQSSGFQILDVILLLPAVVYLGSLCTTPPGWTRLCIFLGNISYPVYLLQELLIGFLYKPSVMQLAIRHPHEALVAFLLLLTVVSHFAFQLYDFPVRSRLTQFYNERIRTPRTVDLLNA